MLVRLLCAAVDFVEEVVSESESDYFESDLFVVEFGVALSDAGFGKYSCGRDQIEGHSQPAFGAQLSQGLDLDSRCFRRCVWR